jgi:hypothetical protein
MLDEPFRGFFRDSLLAPDFKEVRSVSFVFYYSFFLWRRLSPVAHPPASLLPGRVHPFIPASPVVLPDSMVAVGRDVPCSCPQKFVNRVGRSKMPAHYVPESLEGLRPDVEFPTVIRDQRVKDLVRAADALGALMQYNNFGFVRNKRQHRQFGLAVIEMAQVCVCVSVSLCLCVCSGCE